MKLHLVDGLLFTKVELSHDGRVLELDRILVDTGSGGTVFAADQVSDLKLYPEPDDKIRRIAGVGGSEYVFEKRIDALSVGDITVPNQTVEIGALDYGFGIGGIIGLDFLVSSRAVLDFLDLTLKSH